jgi:hypothetical protein
LQLFKQKEPVIANTKVPEHQFSDQSEDAEAATQFLDECELDDYLENKGQWNAAVVTDRKPNIEDILNAPDPNAAAAKGAKGGPEKVELGEGESEIPDEVPLNHYLGDAIETIIKLNFEERASLEEPLVPGHLALKLCILGRAFAGR